MDITNSIASKHLGQKSLGSLKYDPSLLVAIPRVENRLQYDISNDNLPFLGNDVWHCYEFSTMTKNNLPISRVLKLKYPIESEFLVESKSLKLYLNSFNMSNFGHDISTCLKIAKETIEKDLSNALKTNVQAEFLDDEGIFDESMPKALYPILIKGNSEPQRAITISESKIVFMLLFFILNTSLDYFFCQNFRALNAKMYPIGTKRIVKACT